jgi:hypothetical protein
MHPALIERFPRLGAVYQRSKVLAPDNYFAIYDTPTLNENTEKQFVIWEALLQTLDSASFETFLRKAAGRVAARMKAPDRGWSQLVEAFNEVRGYQHAINLGYSSARLLDEQSTPLPDVEAIASTDAKCLLEVKTIQESDEELEMRGQIQSAELGLPQRLKRAIRRKYLEAIEQINGHPWGSEARKICYLIINLDLSTVLEAGNKDLLDSFIKGLQEGDVEIHHLSQYWPRDL